MEKKYYKVVTCRNKKLVSSHTTGPKRVRYIVNQWTEPRKSAPQCLFVFNNFRSALNFRPKSLRETQKIYECEVDIIPNMAGAGIPTTTLMGLPSGTALAKKVKLTKRVY